MKGALLETPGRSYGWTKGPARHKETWCWNYNISEKRKLWKEWKQGNTSKEKYLEAKKKARRAVYQAKFKAEKKDDDYVFKIVKTMVKTNQDITG